MPFDPAKDPYLSRGRSPVEQPRRAAAVTPDDAADLTTYAKALYVGGAGDVRVIPVGNDDAAPVTFKAHPIGCLPVMARRVLSTGTSATHILALFD